MINSTNSNGRSNKDVLRRWINAEDITQQSRNMWIVDFGIDMPEADAKQYEEPYKYVREKVKPLRDQVRNALEKRKWWLHARPAPDYRNAVKNLNRVIVTPIVAKHRLFVWIDSNIPISHACAVFARDDDYFFGVLHSRLHEVWSLRMGTWLGVGNDPRYTPTTTFETFPFPWPPGKEDTASPAYPAIAAAAKQLHEERALWLNPPELTGPQAGLGDAEDLKKRTLTNLYNALVVYRANGGRTSEREAKQNGLTAAARDFAPRLAGLHDALDNAVCAAYGWPVEILQDEEELLRRLLALNLSRAGG
jgi:hypothetical protein